MEEKLKNLKHSLNKSVFNKYRFSEKNKNIILKSVQESQTKEVTSRGITNPFRRISIVFIIIISLFIGLISINPGVATLFKSTKLERPIDEDYLIYDNYYYLPTSKQIDQNEIGEKLGEVKRLGYSNYLKEGDSGDGSNFYIGESYYKINSSPNLEYIAIELLDNTMKEEKGQVTGFEILKRDKPVENNEQQNIYGAKNDIDEVNIAIENIKKQIPVTFELQSENFRPTLVSLDNDGENYKVTLYYEHIKNKDSILFIEQYDESYNDLPKYYNDHIINNFKTNSIDWNEYEDGLFIGKNESIILRVNGQNMSPHEIREYLTLLKTKE